MHKFHKKPKTKVNDHDHNKIKKIARKEPDDREVRNKFFEKTDDTDSDYPDYGDGDRSEEEVSMDELPDDSESEDKDDTHFSLPDSEDEHDVAVVVRHVEPKKKSSVNRPI